MGTHGGWQLLGNSHADLDEMETGGEGHEWSPINGSAVTLF